MMDGLFLILCSVRTYFFIIQTLNTWDFITYSNNSRCIFLIIHTIKHVLIKYYTIAIF